GGDAVDDHGSVVLGRAPVKLTARTVLDARSSASSTYLATTLLLAHSWAALGSSPPLEVVTVGAAPARLLDALRELGAEVMPAQAHPLSPVSMYANKLLGLNASGDTAVLLVDNDVCFLDDVSDLDGRSVRAAVDWKPRVSEAQWE